MKKGKKGKDKKCPRDPREKALLKAASDGDPAVVQEHQSFVDDTVLDDQGNNLLHIACREGHLNVVHYLIAECHMDAQRQTYSMKFHTFQNTPLHVAAQAGKGRVVRYLVQHAKADVHSRNNQDKTPFDVAVEAGRFKVAQGLDGLARGLLSWRPTGRAVLVQELGADVNARGGCRQDTPLHVACHYGGGTHGWEIVKFLVQQAGADVTAKNYRQHTPIDEIPMERENRRYANREDFEADMAYLERNMQIYTFLEESGYTNLMGCRQTEGNMMTSKEKLHNPQKLIRITKYRIVLFAKRSFSVYPLGPPLRPWLIETMTSSTEELILLIPEVGESTRVKVNSLRAKRATWIPPSPQSSSNHTTTLDRTTTAIRRQHLLFRILLWESWYGLTCTRLIRIYSLLIWPPVGVTWESFPFIGIIPHIRMSPQHCWTYGYAKRANFRVPILKRQIVWKYQYQQKQKGAAEATSAAAADGDGAATKKHNRTLYLTAHPPPVLADRSEREFWTRAAKLFSQEGVVPYKLSAIAGGPKISDLTSANNLTNCARVAVVW
eukprot:scaffold4510_cov183-Amphora_coffeaeformis.AAC.72